VLEAVGLFDGGEEAHQLKRQVMFMKTAIKIRKAQEGKVGHDTETTSVRTNSRRRTEAIIKSWIIESRERRRLVLNRLQDVVRRKAI